ncbi:hypothetical protein EV201_0085 [Ancylomarina subtilis]|uniref:Uncharacterized protein n=1 Tax=Ancylomarina subtilis TaxID=1639035 RepID=A0A4V2FST3_9BACT|nr:hypothetical protein EV201_0085 [Ancylomarina subtilis]
MTALFFIFICKFAHEYANVHILKNIENEST